MEQRIRNAAERTSRKRSNIKLVAVSKKFSAADIRTAYRAGMREFGENYVQEFAAKAPDLKDLQDVRFHLIGHLQSNKARLAGELFQVIQTADSEKILQRLDASAAERQASLDILIEVKLSGEENKTGAAPADIPRLFDAARGLRYVRIKGLMTMPPWSEDAEKSRPYFQELARLGRENRVEELSMGMSGDLEVAVEEGATIVRVGTALFGQRPKPSEESAAVHAQ